MSTELSGACLLLPLRRRLIIILFGDMGKPVKSYPAWKRKQDYSCILCCTIGELYLPSPFSETLLLSFSEGLVKTEESLV